jgi:hypothetical protein
MEMLHIAPGVVRGLNEAGVRQEQFLGNGV